MCLYWLCHKCKQEALDEGFSVDTIYMDFQEAFDKVPHERFIHEIKSYGIHQPLGG